MNVAKVVPTRRCARGTTPRRTEPSSMIVQAIALSSGDICSGAKLQMNRRVLGQLDPAGIDDDELVRPQRGLLDPRADDRDGSRSGWLRRRESSVPSRCRQTNWSPRRCRASSSLPRPSARGRRGHSNRRCWCRGPRARTSARDNSPRWSPRAEPRTPTLSGPCSSTIRRSFSATKEMASLQVTLLPLSVRRESSAS